VAAENYDEAIIDHRFMGPGFGGFILEGVKEEI
jgi:hypothetical protein